ncbi:MAG TPA: hypothetical protein VEB21_09225, partial [Terriglobales bacterium]|nr:hypothetical protein [Terriglobales bacterium]
MSDWLIEERARRRLAAEKLLFAKKKAGEIRVCLVYPNRYAVAMGNLGFQAVYEIIDRSPRFVCERAFLPEADEAIPRAGLRSLESRTRVQDFDLIAFSVSFETDYWHVVRQLDLIGIPARSAERDGSHPLVIAGGPAVFLNPEPLADFIDLFLIGEAEEMLPELLEQYAQLRPSSGRPDRQQVLDAATKNVGGAYVPANYQPVFDGAITVDLAHSAAA